MKRTASLAGSPPPSGSTPGPSKPKKPRPSKSTTKATAASKRAAKAGSPPANGTGSAVGSPFPASSPVAGGGGGGDSPKGRGRSRSASVVGGEGGGGGKGKGKAVEVDGDGVPIPLGGGEEDEEPEDEAFAFDDDEFGSNQREAAKQKEDLRVLLEHFDEQQMDRYEAYRRSGLAKGNVRKLVNQVLGQSVAPQILTVVRGFAKVFVGEIVEKARSVADHPGALTPNDLREAYRLYLAEHEGAGVGGTQKKKLFVR